MTSRSLFVCCFALLGLATAGCPGPSSTNDAGTADGGAEGFALGGAVSGLVGSGLVLENAGADPLAVSADGPFTFEKRLADGAQYSVAVRTQPSSPKQTCTVEAGAGAVAGADVTDVAVHCATEAFNVGGTVSGLSGAGLVLQNNGGDDKVITASGSFIFATKVASGGGYDVTIKSQPAKQSCTISGGKGTVGTGNVSSVAVNCSASGFTVGGTITGLAGTVVLQNNGGDDLSLNSTGTFAFATPLASQADYQVTVLTQPGNPSQVCSVANGSGKVGTSNVVDVAVSCVTNTFAVGGTISGLSGTVVLQNNGGDNLSRSTNGAFTFDTPASSGQGYSVSVLTQPVGQDCAVSNRTGVVTTAAITNVAVSCVAKTYTIGGTITGLVGSLVLQNNGGDDLTASAGAFTFATPITSGSSYSVSILISPAGQTCSLSNETAVVAGANVTNVAVSCAPSTYTIGGTVSGLAAGGSVVLRNNGGNDLTVGANGPFTFTAKVIHNGAYLVSVLTPPAGMSCAVTNPSGNATGNVSDVTVTCALLTYPVGGWVTGLGAGMGVTLQNNGGDDLPLTADGAFAFGTHLTSGTGYLVSLSNQTGGAACTVANGSGNVGTGAVTGVVVNCVPGAYVIGGTVTGLSGTLVLQDNLANDLTLTADGAFAFTTPIATGATYAVSVLSAPAGTTCTVANETATVGSANVTDVTVTCAPTPYSVGGNVSGLSTGSLVLQNNGGDDLTVTGDGPFTFATKLAAPASYAVSVLSKPAGLTCSVTGGSGTMGSANVTSVAVTCWAGLNFMAVRVGDGTTALSANCAPVSLEERSVTDGGVIRSIPLPVSTVGAQRQLTLTGSGTSEGGLSLSGDRRFLSLVGYAADAGVAPGTVTRVVARVDAAGTVDTSTQLASSFAGTARAATSVDGSGFWATSSSQGIHYVAFGAAGTSTQVASTPSNMRHVHVSSGQLYASAASSTYFGVMSVGTGTPTTGTATATMLPGLPGAGGTSTYSFAVLDVDSTPGVDTLYLAQDGTAAAGTLYVQKWLLVGSTWTLQSAFAPTFAGATNAGTRGLAAFVTPVGVRVVASTSESPSRLVTFLDPGSGNPVVTALATAPSNTVFRGVAFSPIP